MAESQKTSLLFVLMGGTFKDRNNFNYIKDFLTALVQSMSVSEYGFRIGIS